MDTLIAGLAAAAAVALVGALVWFYAARLRVMLAAPQPLPFFARIDRAGLTITQAEQAVGLRALGEGLRRCAECASAQDCRRGRPVDCPNQPLLRRMLG